MTSMLDDGGDTTLRQVGARPYLRQDAAAELRRYIFSARLKPGAKVPSERELCTLLSLSRTSVREAMRFLEHEGLLEIRQGRAAVVRPLTVSPMIETVIHRLAAERDVLRDLMAVRPPLEVFAARTAAEKRSLADLLEMEHCLDRLQAAMKSGAGTLEDDVLFHDLLYRAAQNSVLLTFSRAVHGLLRSVHEAAYQLGARPNESLAQHTAIFVAVRDGDAAAAAAAMQRHMDSVAQEQDRVLRHLDEVVGGQGIARDSGRAKTAAENHQP